MDKVGLAHRDAERFPKVHDYYTDQVLSTSVIVHRKNILF